MNALSTTTPPVKVGDIVSLRVEGLAAGGDFIGRLGPFAIFVSGGAPGEIDKVEITAVSGTFARGRVVSVEQPSPDRVQPRCPHYGECGGCDLQHLYYPAQLAHKTLLVKEALKRIGGLEEIPVQPAVGMFAKPIGESANMSGGEETWGYRNKAEYFAGRDEKGRIFLGFMRRGTHEVIPISGCEVQHPLNEQVRRTLERLLNLHCQGAEEKDALVKVISRVSFASGRVCVTLVTFGKPVFVITLGRALLEEMAEVSGVCQAATRSRKGTPHSPAEVAAGSPYLIEEIGKWRFRISPDSFFQVNPRQAATLLDVVLRYANAGRGEVVIDGYSGVGTFLLPLAEKAEMATGIEESESALADARVNLKRNHVSQARIYGGEVERVLPRFAAKRWRAEVVVLDPPRKGCGRGVLAAAAKLNPRALVLISCDPATLARDLRFAASLGYPPAEVQPVDMFPHTWHTETVALCVQRSALNGDDSHSTSNAQRSTHNGSQQ